MPATSLGDFAKENAQHSQVAVHGGKARRRRHDAPAEPTGTVVIGLRMTPAEAEWIREYAWRNRTTVGRIVRAVLKDLRDREERQKVATR